MSFTSPDLSHRSERFDIVLVGADDDRDVAAVLIDPASEKSELVREGAALHSVLAEVAVGGVGTGEGRGVGSDGLAISSSKSRRSARHILLRVMLRFASASSVASGGNNLPFFIRRIVSFTKTFFFLGLGEEERLFGVGDGWGNE